MKRNQLLCTLAYLILSTFSYAQYTNLFNFAVATNGNYAHGDLISDGTFLYGMSTYGGTNNAGTIFKILPNGTGFVKLLDFSTSTSGTSPHGSLLFDGTFLYGMTWGGGTNGNGTIFKILPNGTGYTKLLDFASATSGSYPLGSLITDGTYLYGMTNYGGANNMGTIFKILPNGTGFVKLLDFSGTSNGRSPVGSLFIHGTFLYGMTEYGGTNDLGTIFKLTPTGTGFVKLLDFAGAANGSRPVGSLITDGSFLYGMTKAGGTSSIGTVFKIMPNGTSYTKLLDFNGSTNGSWPRGSLISIGSFLYGMTSNGGLYNDGAIFRIMPNGTSYSKLFDFFGPVSGEIPVGSLFSDGTFLYGMNREGSTNNLGVIFKHCIPYTTTATNTGPYCSGATIQLNTSGGNSYVWSGPASYSNSSQNPSILSSTVGMSGTYTAIVTNAAGCTSTATTDVTVNALPTPTATNTGPYCVGDPIQLNSTGGVGYSWSGPISYANATQNPNIPVSTSNMSGTYTATVTNALGCTSTATTDVIVNTLPTSTATNTGPYCEGDTIQLNATGGDNYSWSGPISYTNATQNPSIDFSTTNMSGTYTATVTNTAGCTSTATTNVTVNALPTPTATNTGPYCEGDAIQLNSTGGVGYSWSGPISYANATQNPNIPLSTANMSGTYTATVTNAMGCSSTATTDVIVNTLPTSTATNTGPYCEGATIELNSTGGDSYSWSGPVSYTNATQNPSIDFSTISMSGTYTVTVTNSCGSLSANTLVTINPLPNVTAINNGDGSITASLGSSFEWINCITGNLIPGQTSQTFVATVNGSYAALVEVNGCSDTSACVVIDNIAGIDEVQNNVILLYPNPAKDDVTITMSAATADIEIIDAQGKLLGSSSIVNGETISLSDYEPGVYFFRISTEQNTFLHRIVKT